LSDGSFNVNVTRIVVKNIGNEDLTITSLTLIYVGVGNESQYPIPVLVQVPAKSTIEIPTLILLMRYGNYSWLGYCILVRTESGCNATSLMGNFVYKKIS